MKKIFLFCLTFAASVTVYAANIKMVTYFPVPYASYQNLDVEKTLDVGVMSCAMNLSCPDNQYALNVYQDANPGTSVLKQGYLRVTSGALNLNSSGKAVSNVMTVGNHSGTGGELDFNQSLRIASLSNRGESLQAVNEGNTVSALHMFPDHINNNFPACSGVEGAPDVSWQRLELGAKDGKAVSNVFLVCGKPQGGTSACTPTHNGQTSYTEACPNGQTGQITYTWNSSQCRYDQSSTCKTAPTYKYGPAQTLNKTFRETVSPDSGLSCGMSSYKSFCDSNFGSALQRQQYLSRKGYSGFDNNAVQGGSCSPQGSTAYKPSGISFASGSMGCVRAVSNPNGSSSCDIDIALVIPYFQCQ